MVGTHVDITERKRIGEEPERLRRLEADVAHMNRLAMLELASSLVHEIRHSIDLRTELVPKLPHVFADRVQLQWVLMSLMLNGIETMADEACKLTIRSRGDR